MVRSVLGTGRRDRHSDSESNRNAVSERPFAPCHFWNGEVRPTNSDFGEKLVNILWSKMTKGDVYKRCLVPNISVDDDSPKRSCLRHEFTDIGPFSLDFANTVIGDASFLDAACPHHHAVTTP